MIIVRDPSVWQRNLLHIALFHGKFVRTAWSCVAYIVASSGPLLGLRMGRVLRQDKVTKSEVCFVKAGQACLSTIFMPSDIEIFFEFNTSTVSGAKIVKVNLVKSYIWPCLTTSHLSHSVVLFEALVLIVAVPWDGSKALWRLRSLHRGRSNSSKDRARRQPQHAALNLSMC